MSIIFKIDFLGVTPGSEWRTAQSVLEDVLKPLVPVRLLPVLMGLENAFTSASSPLVIATEGVQLSICAQPPQPPEFTDSPRALLGCLSA